MLAIRISRTPKPDYIRFYFVNMHRLATFLTCRFSFDLRNLCSIRELLPAHYTNKSLFPGPGLAIAVYCFRVTRGTGHVRYLLMNISHNYSIYG